MEVSEVPVTDDGALGGVMLTLPKGCTSVQSGDWFLAPLTVLNSSALVVTGEWTTICKC